MVEERRKIIAQKLFDLVNIEAGIVVFGELVGRGGVRNSVLLFGSAVFILLDLLLYNSDWLM